MHKIFFTILVLLITSNLAFAQSSQLKTANNSLAKLQKSITDKADIKKQLTIIGEGIKAVEIAEKDRKTKNWPETWAIKAYLCSYVALIDENETNAEKYFLAAKGALTSAQKLDKFQSNTELIQAAEHNIYVKMQEKGTVAFQQNDFITSYELLKSVSDFMPADTLLATNVAVCAQNLQQYNDALTYFLKAKQNGAKNPLLFQNIANIYTSKFENELAIKTLEEGLSLNANHPQLTNDYINILLDNEQYEKATNAVETSLKIDKQNKLLFFLYGYLYQNRGNTNTAELSYKKALEIDYNYFEALYQLALAYIQEANEALKQKNNKKFTANINRAEYSLLRAHDLNINHKNTMKLLVEIYTRKNKLDKVQELKRKLNEF
ncbi:tetratricopeptide repeat protein [Pedobacter sp.]